MAFLFIDGQKANLSQQEFSSFHGYSVFTTMRSRKHEILLFKRHWQRLTLHAAFFGFHMPKEEDIYDLITNQIKSAFRDQKIRIIITKTNWALSLEEAEAIDPNIYKEGVDVCISSFQVHPQLASLKTGNSLPYILSFEEAKKQGKFESLLLDNQHRIVDGSRTSLMTYDGRALISLEGGLKGCMRDEIIAYAQSLNIEVKYCYKKPDELRGQLLLANSLLGLVPVGKIKYKLVENLVAYFCRFTQSNFFCENII